MMSKTILFVFAMLFVLSSLKASKMNIVLERVEVKYFDPNYIEQVSANIKKLNRASNYLLNFNMDIIHPIYNNVSIKVVNFQMQSNVYKESVFNVEEPVCESLKNKLFLTVFANYTNIPKKCPMVGNIYMKDLEISLGSIPIFFPTSQYRFDVSMNHKVEKKQIFMTQLFLKVEEKHIAIKGKAGRKILKN